LYVIAAIVAADDGATTLLGALLDQALHLTHHVVLVPLEYG